MKTTEAAFLGAKTQNMTMIYQVVLAKNRYPPNSLTYSQESEDVDDEHDILEHRHGSSTIDVAKVHDERDRPDLVQSANEK